MSYPKIVPSWMSIRPEFGDSSSDFAVVPLGCKTVSTNRNVGPIMIESISVRVAILQLSLRDTRSLRTARCSTKSHPWM